MLRQRADVAVRARDGALQLEVEVKTKRGAAHEWAAKLVRNLLIHGAGPSAPYFMLALPDKVYLWDLHEPTSRLASRPELGPEPDYAADTAPAFGPYFPDGEVVPDRNESEDALVLAVASWLTDILTPAPDGENLPGDLRPDMRALLFDSGLYDAARGGTVATEAVLS